MHTHTHVHAGRRSTIPAATPSSCLLLLQTQSCRMDVRAREGGPEDNVRVYSARPDPALSFLTSARRGSRPFDLSIPVTKRKLGCCTSTPIAIRAPGDLCVWVCRAAHNQYTRMGRIDIENPFSCLRLQVYCRRRRRRTNEPARECEHGRRAVDRGSIGAGGKGTNRSRAYFYSNFGYFSLSFSLSLFLSLPPNAITTRQRYIIITRRYVSGLSAFA